MVVDDVNQFETVELETLNKMQIANAMERLKDMHPLENTPIEVTLPWMQCFVNCWRKAKRSCNKNMKNGTKSGRVLDSSFFFEELEK